MTARYVKVKKLGYQTSGLHSGSRVNGIPEETVPRHFDADHAGDRWSGMDSCSIVEGILLFLDRARVGVPMIMTLCKNEISRGRRANSRESRAENLIRKFNGHG